MMNIKISFNNVTKKFLKKTVLNSSNVCFNYGKISSIVAPNGEGKTTTINLIAGFLIPDEGKIEFPNSISNKDISVVFGGDRNLYMKNTVRENISYISGLKGVKKERVEENIKKFKKFIPSYDDIEDTVCEMLSHGQKRLVSILVSLVSDTKVIILDEVTEGLDKNHIYTLEQMLKEVKKEKIIILCSQNLEFIERISDSIFFLKNNNFVKADIDMRLSDQYILHYGGFKDEIS